jgi:4-alpha-glucanotransferase
MRTLFMTSASLAIVPIQDMLGYGADTRINIPGTASGNWLFRIREGVLDEIDIDFYVELHKAYQREDSIKSYKPQPVKTGSPLPIGGGFVDDDPRLA